MRVMVVAYYYPPISSGGTERPFQLVKHLTRRGHEVSVVTQTYRRPDVVSGSELRIYDPSHNRDRVGAGAVAWLARRLVVGGLNLAGGYTSIYSAWKRRVLGRADRLIGASRPDVLVATYPPVENLEIGLALAERFQIPLVSDFRDGLLFEPIERDHIRRHRCVEDHYRKLERTVAERSAGLVTVFPSLSDYFRSSYGRHDVVTIPNGFDAEDFQDLRPSGLIEPDAYNIVHAGGFGSSYSGRDVRPLAEALTVAARAPLLDRALKVHLIGSLTSRERRCFGDLMADGVVVEHGLQPRPIALAAQIEADLLLLLTSGDRPGSAPGKLFEYLCAGRPILGLTSGSFAEEIIRDTGSGWTVDPGDPAAIADVLLAVASGQPPPGFAPARDRIGAYARDRQVARFEAVLREVAADGSPENRPIGDTPSGS